MPMIIEGVIELRWTFHMLLSIEHDNSQGINLQTYALGMPHLLQLCCAPAYRVGQCSSNGYCKCDGYDECA